MDSFKLGGSRSGVESGQSGACRAGSDQQLQLNVSEQATCRWHSTALHGLSYIFMHKHNDAKRDVVLTLTVQCKSYCQVDLLQMLDLQQYSR